MAKANNKTQLTDDSVEAFLNTVTDEQQQRADAFRVLEMFKRLTGEEPKMWGATIIGFGVRHLKYESGREMDWMVTGFSPRKGNLTLYVNDSSGGSADLMAQLGKHKTGKGCLYIKKLSDVDEAVLEKVILGSIERTTKTDSCT